MNKSYPMSVRAVIALALLVSPAPAYAQLDPLLFLKTTQPNVILAVDTAARMQYDSDHTYYDVGTYLETGLVWEPLLGLEPSEASKYYRRKYFNLQHLNASGDGDRFSADSIAAVGDLQNGYGTFYDRTRLAIARRALIQAVTNNQTNARFGLVKTRQGTVTLPSAGNEGPVTVSNPSQLGPTDRLSLTGKWKITHIVMGSSNSAQTSSGSLVVAGASGANSTILTTLGKEIGTAGALLPAGNDGKDVVDAPVGLLLDDARTQAASLIAADDAVRGCRNTVVVLVVGGGEGTISPQDLAAKASTFLNVSGRRVPIYVLAILPDSDAVPTLKQIAANSGGQYFEVTPAVVEATKLGEAVPEAVRAINTAIQHGFVPTTTFNELPTSELPFGQYGESHVTSPIVGTVNLRGASKLDSSGLPQVLPDSETYIFNGTAEIPQRSNVLVTSGFVLPGFEARLRAFRVYRPVPDTTKPSGYRFTQDGSRLWVSSTPSAGSRNIYTVLPGGSAMVPFDVAHVGELDDYLGVKDPSTLITWVRSQPLGAVVGSTPAFLDPPSLDPPPDADYPAFSDRNKDRRSLIIYGGNDGMLHAVDARTGIEVWAFIPFNLLPKLRALRYGQSLDAFNYFVDSSPKIADVKVDDKWRTYLFFGQGAGGTFYNTMDVTLEGINEAVNETSTNDAALLAYFAQSDRITWKWSFPRNTSFDVTLEPYGELSADNASTAEKTIGETWSDPAVGQLQDENGPYAMIVGSGFLKYSVQNTRRTGVTRAGTTFYVLDVETGEVLGKPQDVGADSHGETVDDCRAANDCRRMKNALQMDPVASGILDQRFITKVYIGDLDGKLWKFTIGVSGGEVSVSAPIKLYDATADFPLFSSMATVNVGGTNQYIFVGTGSDLLPSNGVNQNYNLLVLLDNGSSVTKTAEILLEKTDWPETAGGDEKVSAFPAVAGDIVFFTTTTYSPTTPCSPFSANLYAFTFIGGPAYDTNNDGTLTTGTTSTKSGKKGESTSGTTADSQKVFSQSGVRATAPFIVDQHLAFSAGGNIQMFGDPNDFNNGVGQAGVRILSWRAVK